MDIGIGLPATIPGVEGPPMLDWARRAEDAGFSSLGTIDRIVYPNYEPLIALAAAAAVTERVRLTTAIAIVPYRFNAALVAKQAATIHHLSGGRFVLGAAVGGREDDYEASGVSMRDRGKRMDAMLADIERRCAATRSDPRSIRRRRSSSAATPTPPSSGPPASARAGSAAAAGRGRLPKGASRRSPHGSAPGATTSRESSRSPTTGSTAAPRPRATTCATTTPSSAREPTRSPLPRSRRPRRSPSRSPPSSRPAATS
jgi:alkanesulfonate monooxygenase SsuD/methylene tetrahydromethanopterin reductase-like flavin-dependent oxidoreductase (luciferase family)